MGLQAPMPAADGSRTESQRGRRANASRGSAGPVDPQARRTRGAAFLALMFALGWAAIFFAATGHPHAHETAGSYVGFGVCFFGGAVLCVLYARRLSRAGLLLTRDRVVVRGPIRTWTVSLADAETFEPGIQPSFGNGTPCPMLKRRNGRAIGVWALGRERDRDALRSIPPRTGAAL
jgi:hypothetical protein